MRLNINLQKVSEMGFQSREAYKTLRTNIEFCGSEINVISITSSAPNEGKSFVAFNLAISFSEAGKRVLFIDADMRKSVFIGRYRINKSITGLTQLLSGVSTYENSKYTTNIQNLDMILSGPVPPNPAELLASPRFEDLINRSRNDYDFVILDSPPVGSVIDPTIIAAQCDGVIYLIEQAAVSYRYAQRQMDQLRRSGCRILGAILNKVDLEDKGYYSYSYYGYGYKYRYGYGYGHSYGSYNSENSEADKDSKKQ